MNQSRAANFLIDNHGLAIYHHANGQATSQHIRGMGPDGEPVMIDPKKITTAIAEAEQELGDVGSQLEAAQMQRQHLQQRATQLQSFITSGKTLLGEAAEDQDLSMQGEAPTETVESLPDDIGQTRPTAADYARKLLEQVQRPMKVADIARELVQRGLVQGRWAREVLRAGMGRRDDFERIAPGVYVLKKWPPAFKRWKQQDLLTPTPGGVRVHRRTKVARVTMSLTEAILEVLNVSNREMSPPEIEHAITQMGRPVYKDSVSGTLSRLVKENRVRRMGPGKYAAMRMESIETPAMPEQSTLGNSDPWSPERIEALTGEPSAPSPSAGYH